MTDRPSSSTPARRLKILAIAYVLPKPDQNGGGLLTFRLLGMLAEQHQVTLLTFSESLEIGDDQRDGEIARYQAMYRHAGVRLIRGHSTVGVKFALLKTLYDVVLFEFWTCARNGLDLVLRYQPWAKIIIETVDINFRRETAAVGMGLLSAEEAEANRAAEVETYRQVAALICISDEDARALEDYQGIGLRAVIPHVIEPLDRPARERGADLLFIGGFGHAPNPDGIAWFAAEIWPAIARAVPAARLRVVGSHPTPEVLALGAIDGIEVVGWVPDITPLCDEAALLIAPLRFGGGVKIKVVEAMARGLPVVTTPVGVQGLDVRSGEHLMVAGDAAEFARQVEELLRDPARAEQIGRQGREYIVATSSSAAVKGRLEGLLAALDDGGRPRIPPPRWLAQVAIAQVRKGLSLAKRTLRGARR